MTISQERFIKNFTASFGAVFQVGMWLKNQGWDVSFPVPKFPELSTLGDRPTLADRMQHQDDGDIEAKMRLEVKRREDDRMIFTCADNYPFDDIFVSETYKADPILKEHLLGFVIVNYPRTHAAFIPRTSRQYWFKKTILDHKQDRECEMYCCPKQYAKFLRILPNVT